MTRRWFFRLLGLAAVTAPVTGTLVPERLAAVRHWWVPTERWVKEFNWGTSFGVCGAFRNVLTGEQVRNAVRVLIHADGAAATAARAEAVTLLHAWADDLPAWRVPVQPGHGHFDDVLEGREPMTITGAIIARHGEPV